MGIIKIEVNNMNEQKSKIVVTVVGKDKPGIIAKVSTILAENGANILDISQTIMQGFFTMIMIVDIQESGENFAKLKEILSESGDEIGVKISAQHEEVFEFMHRI